jgi:type I restriction enzyme S subunit
MSLPKYKEYKDSGVEWLGCVPSHWAAPKLKQFTRFSGGGTPSRDIPNYWNGNIPWVSPKDMKAECIETTEERITVAGMENSTSNLVEAGRILLVVRSGILKHTIPVAINSVPVTLNQDMKALSFDAGICAPMFLMRWIQGLNDSLLVAWAKQGATVESIEHSYLADTVVPLPPLEEQNFIVAFLDRETSKIDTLIAEQKKLIALLAEKRQAVISNAVTKGLNSNVLMRYSGVEWLGNVPVHWDVVRIKRVITSIEQGWSPQCENFPVSSSGEWGVLKVGCVNGGVFEAEENKKLPPELEPMPNYSVKRDDLLISRANTRELVGSAAVVENDFDNLMLCDKLYRIRLDQARCIPAYLAAYLGTPQARSSIELEATGASSSMLNIGQSAILDLFAPIPSVTEQCEIERFLRTETARFDSLSTNAERAIVLLKERRSALIAAAVTGQIDVRGAVSEVGAEISEPIAA